jgi:superfamily II DNA or RNA helicase
LARLILSVYGVSALRELRPWLAAAGLQPPTRWAGSPSAIAFTRDLGFPDAFAGSHETKRTPWMDVDGPIDLNPLHPFQMTIAERIGEFLRRQRPGRGFVSLPTGAGKTRVVTESLVREFRNGTLTETILWIADRDELCEQAVQTWREVWRAKGPQDNLRISRLWGDTNSAVVATPGRPHLVVASYQSLVRRLGGGFSWILDAQAIVVDEAHGSIAPSYTNILSSFGLDAFVTERPLIGLSATPFRGRMEDDEETRRLVNRYGAHRFDNGVFEGDDPYPELRRIKVLSDVDWQELPGSPITLNANEMAQLQQFKVLPRAAEGRLGREASRNESIIRAVRACPSDWPILLFATSVDHAELLAGLLALEGISAQAISSRTRQDVRRYAIEAFRRKDIRVLTNYGVLTTGFDAPETRAIFVARPVYSPGLYQQMIGRGLRGPLNGGTDKCLIVNVADNVLAYGEQLAFRQFEHLWKMGDPAQQSLPLVP